MAVYREELVAAMRELIDAHARGREAIDRADVLLRFGIEQLESGADVLGTLPRASEREATQEAFKRTIDGRHALRLEILSVCLDLGMKPGLVEVDRPGAASGPVGGRPSGRSSVSMVRQTESGVRPRRPSR